MGRKIYYSEAKKEFKNRKGCESLMRKINIILFLVLCVAIFANILSIYHNMKQENSNTQADSDEVKLLDVKFFQNGKEIVCNENWYAFNEGEVEIFLTYEGNPNYVELLSAPTGTNVADMEEVIHKEYIYSNTGNYTLKVSKDEIGDGTHRFKIRIYELHENISDDIGIYFE